MKFIKGIKYIFNIIKFDHFDEKEPTFGMWFYMQTTLIQKEEYKINNLEIRNMKKNIVFL